MYKTQKTKPSFSFNAFIFLFAIAIAKITHFEEYKQYGFNFFEGNFDITGYTGSTHLISTIFVYFFAVKLIQIFIKVAIGIAKKSNNNIDEDNFLEYKSEAKSVTLLNFFKDGYKTIFTFKKQENHNILLFAYLHIYLAFIILLFAGGVITI